MEELLDRLLSRFFSLFGFRKCSKCYLRVRIAQLLFIASRPVGRLCKYRRLQWEQVGWPERFELKKAPMPFVRPFDFRRGGRR